MNNCFILAAYACFCAPCYTAQLTDRVGDHLLTCCLNPFSLMAVRTKVRTAFKIQVSVYINISYFVAYLSWF